MVDCRALNSLKRIVVLMPLKFTSIATMKLCDQSPVTFWRVISTRRMTEFFIFMHTAGSVVYSWWGSVIAGKLQTAVCFGWWRKSLLQFTAACRSGCLLRVYCSYNHEQVILLWIMLQSVCIEFITLLWDNLLVLCQYLLASALDFCTNFWELIDARKVQTS